MIKTTIMLLFGSALKRTEVQAVPGWIYTFLLGHAYLTVKFQAVHLFVTIF